MTSDISRREFLVHSGIVSAALTFPSQGRAMFLCPGSLAVESLRNDLQANAVGKLRRIHCSRGGCSPATVREEHGRWLDIFLALADRDSLTSHHTIHSIAHPEKGLKDESFITSLSFDSALQVELITSTARSLQERITFRGEGGEMHLDTAGLASLSRNSSLNRARTGMLHHCFSFDRDAESLERAPLQHATLLMTMLEQAEQNTLVSGRLDPERQPSLPGISV